MPATFRHSDCQEEAGVWESSRTLTGLCWTVPYEPDDKSIKVLLGVYTSYHFPKGTSTEGRGSAPRLTRPAQNPWLRTRAVYRQVAASHLRNYTSQDVLPRKVKINRWNYFNNALYLIQNTILRCVTNIKAETADFFPTLSLHAPGELLPACRLTTSGYGSQASPTGQALGKWPFGRAQLLQDPVLL